MVAGALLLAGCATVRIPAVPPESGALLVEALRAVRGVANALEAGEEADFPAARAALDAAHVSAVVDAVGAEPEVLAGHAALGVTIGLCSEGLDRVERRLGADPAAGPGLAVALRLGCVGPLALFQAG